MPEATMRLEPETIERLGAAACDQTRVAGLTHRHYRYPARFSPGFARACIEAFTRPGDRVLDPYMGGGTSLLEALVLGRRAYGVDLNSLAVFVARTKLSALTPAEGRAVACWAEQTVPALRSNMPLAELGQRQPKNMSLPAVRALKKTIALCLASAQGELPTPKAVRFAQGVLLNVGQWALNGKKHIPSSQEFRARVATTAVEMLDAEEHLKQAVRACPGQVYRPVIMQGDAAGVVPRIAKKAGAAFDLVVTSPPYPGVHMLYHRWQVDGRKESDAPYWITGCEDGAGAAFYNFADRTPQAEARYFERALACFVSVRGSMRRGGVLAQLVAFSRPEEQLAAYLVMLRDAGFADMVEQQRGRFWRSVPNRSWHASSKGGIPASREVLLLHRAD